MTDVLIVAVIVAFFALAAIVVRLLYGMIAHAGTGTDADADAEPGSEPGELAR